MDIWAEIQNIIEEEVPLAIQQVLIASGFDNFLSLRQITQDDVTQIEEFCDGQMFPNDRIYSKQLKFKLIPGHRKFIFEMSNKINMVKENLPKKCRRTRLSVIMSKTMQSEALSETLSVENDKSDENVDVPPRQVIETNNEKASETNSETNSEKQNENNSDQPVIETSILDEDTRMETVLELTSKISQWIQNKTELGPKFLMDILISEKMCTLNTDGLSATVCCPVIPCNKKFTCNYKCYGKIENTKKNMWYFQSFKTHLLGKHCSAEEILRPKTNIRNYFTNEANVS